MKNYLLKYQVLITFGAAPFILFPTVSPVLNAAAWSLLLITRLAGWRVTGHFFRRTPVDVCILIILLLLPISVWASVDTMASVVALNRILWGIVLFYSLGSGLTNPRQLYLLLGLIVLGGGAIALIGLVAADWNESKITFLTPYYQYLPQISKISGVLAGRSNQSRGLFHPNIIAVAISMIIPLGVGLLPLVKILWQKAALWLILLFMGGVLFLTQSRLAIAALLIVLWFITASRRRWLWSVALAALLVLAALILYLGPAQFWSQFTDAFFGTGTGTWQSRQDVWRNAMLALGDFSFTGIGLAVFEPVSRMLYPYYVAAPSWNFRHAHDNFLQVGLDLGLGGLVAYIALLLGLIWIGRQAYRASAEPFRSVVRGVLGSLGVYIGFGLFDALPFWIKPGFLPWLVFGLLVVTWRMSSQKTQQPNPKPKTQDPKLETRNSKPKYLPLILFAAVFIFYLATLAPTVLWGDEAFFQRTAYEGTLKADGGGHWLWLQAARLFVYMPWGDAAWRVNLLSAVAAAFAIVLLYAAGRAMGLRTTGAIVAALSMAVAHTFWTYAVRAEVYTLFMLLMALQLWLWFSWQPKRPWPILAAAALFGITLLGHQMALLLLPAFAFLLWRQRYWLNKRQWTALASFLVIGLLPVAGVIRWQIGSKNLLTDLYRYFTQSSEDFSGALLDFSLASLPRDAAMWIGLLGFQFVGLAGLLALWGWVDVWRKGWPAPWLAAAILYITCLFFAFSYHVNDQFVFYLPSYLVTALFVGRGWQAASESWAWVNKAKVFLLALILVVPLLTYRITPRLLTSANIDPLNARELPGRAFYHFFLWPAKNGYVGAADYGQTVLQTLPPNSVLIADYTPAQTILYYKSVEGLRRDVRVVHAGAGRSLAKIIKRFPADTRFFLADNNPNYYDLRSAPEMTLEPFGNIYEFTP